MNNNKEKIINDNMKKILHNVNDKKSSEGQIVEGTTYCENFGFNGSNFEEKDVYIVEILCENSHKTGDKPQQKYTIYELYNKNGIKIADVDIEGKVHFSEEYIDRIDQLYNNYIEEINLEDLYFDMSEIQNDKNIKLTKEEIDELVSEKEKIRGTDGEQKTKDEKIEKETKEEIKEEQKTADEEKRETAEALNVDESEIKSISTIDPNQKVTDEYALRDIIPEIATSKLVTVAYTKNGNFVLLKTKEDGTKEKLNSVDPIEGVSTNKSVISINEDGSNVEEKQVKGLMRINSRNRDDGISISIGDYGMMNIDYINNVMDKENRRMTPIRTNENQRIASQRVRENAGDTKEEIKKEGRNYRVNEEKGINLQKLDDIETNTSTINADIEDLKEQIKDEILQEGDMSIKETRDFIKARIEESGLNFTEDKEDSMVEEIQEMALDESRFPSRSTRN